MTGSKHILVVDDEPSIGTLVKRCLAMGGHQVTTAENGDAMRRALRRGDVDLVILDLMLPGESGLDLLRDLRARHAVPVIILTALGEPVDRVIGLELGADDYVAKPFEPREIAARVRNVLRRGEARRQPDGEADTLVFAGYRLHLPSRQLTAGDGAEVPLTTAEFDLLAALAGNANRVLSRDQLLDLARHRTATPFDRSVDVYIGHLRRKIEADPKNPKLIKTVYGVGYIFTPAVEQG